MKRVLFAMFLSAGVLASVMTVATPARASGNFVLTNSTVDAAVNVEVNQGNSTSDAVPAAYGTLSKGDNLKLDTTNLQYFWRRQLNPGEKTAKWSDWQTIDTRGGDQKASF